MNNFLLLIRLLLAGVFCVAGITKLLDLKGSAEALTNLGLPKPFARPIGILLPLGELAIALALLPTQSAWLGAIGGAGLLVAFLTGIAVNLARGRRPDCHCFGQLYSAPIGAETIARNLILLVATLAVVATGPGGSGPSAIAWIGDLSPAGIIEFVGAIVAIGLLAANFWELRALRGQIRRLPSDLPPTVQNPGQVQSMQSLKAAQGRLPIGTPAPQFRLTDPHNNLWSLNGLLASGHPLLLIFSDVDCGACNLLLPLVAGWQHDRRDLTVALISRGSQTQNLAKGTEYGLTTLLVAADRNLARSYGAAGTPSALLISVDGRVASEVAAGAEAVRALVDGIPTAPVYSTREVKADMVTENSVDPPKPGTEPAVKDVVISNRSLPKPHPEVATTELDGEAVVYDARDGQIHQLNLTASLVWSLFDGSTDVGEIAETVAEVYGISPDEASNDVSSLVREFALAGLIVVG